MDDLLEDGVAEGTRVEDKVRVEIRTFMDEERGLLQVPKAGLQPDPQCKSDIPQYSYELQQLPKVEPRQVCPFDPAHLPSVETFVDSFSFFGVQVPYPGWQPDSQ